MKSSETLMNEWLASGQTARICGLDFEPVPHPAMPDTPQCVVKGQASVFFLRQTPHNNTWLLKKFAPARRPMDDYLQAVTQYLPGDAAFFTCTQRRFVQSSHLDRAFSGFNEPQLGSWLEGTILMPKVPGEPWMSVADSLREEEIDLPADQRIRAAANLAKCIKQLEAAHCSHRDLSSTNVFLTKEDKVYLIDWDCLYHAQLPFQPNTTVGTNGYIAPFLNVSSSLADPSRSWCEHADRFALATLITEFLLVGPNSPEAQEDGTLFSQAQLTNPKDKAIKRQLKLLGETFLREADLLKEALDAQTFDTCPSPDMWISALRGTLNRIRSHSQQSRTQRTTTCVPCSHCSTQVRVRQDKLEELQKQGKPILCKPCLKKQSEQWSLQSLERNTSFPTISCEHCQTAVRVPREKLDTLRAKGSPILCKTCLDQQLQKWSHESCQLKKKYTQTACHHCHGEFRIHQDKLAQLESKAKPVLCRSCLEQQIQQWAIEREQRQHLYVETACADCQKAIRLKREKHQELLSRGKAVLCSDCLTAKLQARPAITQPSVWNRLNVLRRTNWP